jgi:hypothetical protein
MSLLVKALEIHTPEFVKKLVVMQLFKATAAAFDLDVPAIRRLDSKACLAEYARFVQTHGEERLRDRSDVETVAQRLYQNAFEMGRLPGKWLRPHNMQEVMAIGRLLYRILAIDLQGDAPGEVVIKRCYFSGFYSAEVCRLMSAMDRGLFAGLSNGGELTFTSRITEGQPCCRAHFCLPPTRVNNQATANR